MKSLWLKLQLTELVLRTKLSRLGCPGSCRNTNFRLDKKKQVTDRKYLSQEEQAKVEQNGKELGWFTHDMGMTNGHPNKTLTIYIKQIIIAKLRFEYYARSNALGAKL